MEQKNINGFRVLDKQTANEIIAWCENDEYLKGGRVKDVEKRISDGDGGYKDVSYERWHFEKIETMFGLCTYCHVDIQAILLDKYVATIEVGVRREDEKGVEYPTVASIYESIIGLDDLLWLMIKAWDVVSIGESVIHRQQVCND